MRKVARGRKEMKRRMERDGREEKKGKEGKEGKEKLNFFVDHSLFFIIQEISWPLSP